MRGHFIGPLRAVGMPVHGPPTFPPNPRFHHQRQVFGPRATQRSREGVPEQDWAHLRDERDEHHGDHDGVHAREPNWEHYRKQRGKVVEITAQRVGGGGGQVVDKLNKLNQ